MANMKKGDVGLTYFDGNKTLIIGLAPNQHQMLQLIVRGLGNITAAGGYYLQLMMEGKNGKKDQKVDGI